jgi:hypothetical protein
MIFSPLVHGLICVGRINHHCGAIVTFWQMPIVFFPSVHGFVLCKQNGGAMVVSAHYFFPSYSWFHFCVGRIDHHCGATIVGGHNFFIMFVVSFCVGIVAIVYDRSPSNKCPL